MRARVEWHFLLLMLLAGVVCFLFLDRGALYYDEAIYAQVAKETVQGGHWLTLHWNGLPWFHKPPFYFWATALLFKAFGESEFLARFVSALAGVACVAVCYLTAKHLRDRTTGLISGVILLSTPLFVCNARQGMTDVLLTLFLMLTVYAYLNSIKDPRWWVVAGLSSGLAVLTKGAAGLLAPAIVGVSLLLDLRLRDLRRFHLWLGVVLFVVVGASWHVALLAIHGEAFVNEYLYRHVIQRSAMDLHSYDYGYSFYPSVLWQFMWPWVLSLPFAILTALRRHSKALIVQSLLPLLLFSFARTKFPWYILPAIPALAILTAQLIQYLIAHTGTHVKHLAWLTVVLFSIVGAIQVVDHCAPNKKMQIVAALARVAARDEGAISSCPEALEMTVLYYSNRKLCTDPVVSPLTFNPLTKCEPGEIRHFIFETAKKPIIESRFRLQVLREDQGISYAAVIE